MNMEDAMLELRNISKVYSSKSRVLVYALKDVNLIFGDKGGNIFGIMV